MNANLVRTFVREAGVEHRIPLGDFSITVLDTVTRMVKEHDIRFSGSNHVFAYLDSYFEQDQYGMAFIIAVGDVEELCHSTQ